MRIQKIYGPLKEVPFSDRLVALKDIRENFLEEKSFTIKLLIMIQLFCEEGFNK